MANFVEQKLTPSYLKTLVSFLTILHSGQLGWDGQYFFTADKTGIGVQNTQRLGDQIDKTKANEEATLQDVVNAWNALRQAGQLVYMQNPPAVEQPTPPTQPGEMDIVAKEIALQAKQRREAGIPGVRNYAKDDTRINGDAILAERARKAHQDEQDWQSFRSEIGTAEAINIIGYQGNISWGQTNDARRVAIEKCKSTWTKKHPEWAGRIEQYNSSVIQPVQQALPDNPTREQMNAVSPEVLRQWLKNQRHANRERLGEPSNNC